MRVNELELSIVKSPVSTDEKPLTHLVLAVQTRDTPDDTMYFHSWLEFNQSDLTPKDILVMSNTMLRMFLENFTVEIEENEQT